MHRLKAIARREHASVASLIRRGVDVILDEDDELWERALSAVGALHDDGPLPHGPLSVNHDDYLADAMDEEVARWHSSSRTRQGS